MTDKEKIEMVKRQLVVDIWGTRTPEKPDAEKLAEYFLNLPTVKRLIRKALDYL